MSAQPVLTLLAQEVASLLRSDSRRVLLGEDVRDGGMLGLSRAAAEDPSLADRILSTPLVGASLAAHAGGLALAGQLPIVLLSSGSTLLESLSAVREVARVGWTSGDLLEAPVLFVAPTGPGFGLGGEAAESPEHALASIPGLRVVCGSDPHELPALLREAADFSTGRSPTVLLLPRTSLLAQVEADAVAQAVDGGLASSKIRVYGSDAQATVFCWGGALEVCELAAEESGVSTTVVDLGSLAPLDEVSILEHAAQTGKLVIAHPGWRGPGLGSELAALFADRAILHLDAPVLRVTGSPGPISAGHEDAALPTVAAVVDAIRTVANY